MLMRSNPDSTARFQSSESCPFDAIAATDSPRDFPRVENSHSLEGIAPVSTKTMLIPKRWTFYRVLTAGEEEIVASCQGGRSQVMTNNNTNGTTTTEAAANIPSLPKMSG